ncbi:MAG: hypothetical protein ACRECP_04775 [Methylocella sp.]
MRQDFREHMEMFSRRHAGDDLDAQFFADLPDNPSYPLPKALSSALERYFVIQTMSHRW